MKKLLFPLVMAGFFSMAGCSPAPEVLETAPRPSPPPPARMTSHGLSVPLLTEEGDLSLGDMSGRVVLLDFWATWNAPSIQERAALADLYRAYEGQDVVFLGLCLDPGDPANVAAWLGRFDIPYRVGHATESVKAAFPGLRVIPAQVLLDRTGTMREVFQGPLDRGALETAILALLEE